MPEMLKALVEHLRDAKDRIIRTAQVKGVRYDPTFGPQSYSEEVDVVDFDRLLEEIDAFADTFKERGETGAP